jgi:hypothetical protein
MTTKTKTKTTKKVQTIHPQPGKQNKPIAKEDYDLFKAAITAALRKKELSHTELLAALGKALSGKFDGNVGWCAMTVKLDLEARRIIERRGTKPERYRLA